MLGRPHTLRRITGNYTLRRIFGNYTAQRILKIMRQSVYTPQTEMGTGMEQIARTPKQIGAAMMMADANQKDLTVLADMMQSGKVKPVIDRTYKSLGEIPDAIRYLEEGHARGKVVVNVE